MSANQTASAPKLHPCHVCGRQPVLLAENDDASFQYRCQCAEEMSLETEHFSTAKRAASEWNRINEPCGSPLLHTEVSWHPLACLLKSCPFCEGKPELHKCPNGPIGLDAQEEEGWFVRCLCDSGDTVAETVWQPTVRAAVDAWNTRAGNRSFQLSQQHIPFILFAAGSFLFSVGAGFNGGLAASFLTFGAALSVSSLFLPQTHALLREKLQETVHLRQNQLRSEAFSVLRPDLPSCSLCGEVPSLHKTVSGRFRVQCSDHSCWGSARKRFVHLTASEAAAAWTEAQKKS